MSIKLSYILPVFLILAFGFSTVVSAAVAQKQPTQSEKAKKRVLDNP